MGIHGKDLVKEMKKLILGISLLAALLFTSAIPATAHAASQTFNAPASPQVQEPIQWSTGSGGCSNLADVEIASVDGIGYNACFFFTNGGSDASGYLGLGDPAGPGDISQAFHLVSEAGAPSGWIKYYDGLNYPDGTYCQFSTGQYIRFNPFVYVTQIALNAPNSYPQCQNLAN